MTWRVPCLYGPCDGGIALVPMRPQDGQELLYVGLNHSAIYQFQAGTEQLVMVGYRNRRLGDLGFQVEPC